MDPDINKYDLNHRVAHHAQNVGRRNGRRPTGRRGTLSTRPSTCGRCSGAPPRSRNGRPKQIASTIMWFKLMIDHEGVHPLEGGALRLKSRRDRRSGLPLESPLVFYPRYWGGTAIKAVKYLRFFLRTRGILKEVARGAGPLRLHRPRHRAAEGRRVRGARTLSRHLGGRGGARPQEARRQHPRGRRHRRPRQRNSRPCWSTASGPPPGSRSRRPTPRAGSSARSRPSAPGSRPTARPAPTGEGGFRAEAGRYHLYAGAGLPLGDARSHRPQAEEAGGSRVGRHRRALG